MSNFVSQCLEGLFRLTEAIHFPSYALALIILTVIIKLILLPLNIKQMKSMKGLQVVQPLMKELDKKYANNPQKKQEEMMKLYQEHNINPLAGCLPLLIQMPIIMVLYRGLLAFSPANPGHYNFFWIPDLSRPDTTIILPVLVAVFTFLQSYTSTGLPKDSMQKVMVYGMPLMLGWMATNFPSGICIYWIVFSIMGILQQVFVNRGLTPASKSKREEEKQAAVIDVAPVTEPSPSAGVKNPNTSKKKKK